MRNIIRVSIGLAVLVIVIMAGLLSGKVGGIAIRHVGKPDALTLDLVLPIVVGTPVKVEWAATASDVPQGVAPSLRTEAGEENLGQGQFDTGALTVELPCRVDEGVQTLVLRSLNDSRVLASQEITLLPPGPECVR